MNPVDIIDTLTSRDSAKIPQAARDRMINDLRGYFLDIAATFNLLLEDTKNLREQIETKRSKKNVRSS